MNYNDILIYRPNCPLCNFKNKKSFKKNLNGHILVRISCANCYDYESWFISIGEKSKYISLSLLSDEALSSIEFILHTESFSVVDYETYEDYSVENNYKNNSSTISIGMAHSSTDYHDFNFIFPFNTLPFPDKNKLLDKIKKFLLFS